MISGRLANGYYRLSTTCGDQAQSQQWQRFLDTLHSRPQLSLGHMPFPYSGYEPGLTPEQWDAIPLAGKIQIFGIIGMLESYGEILPPLLQWWTSGYYPPIKGNRFELTLSLRPIQLV